VDAGGDIGPPSCARAGAVIAASGITSAHNAAHWIERGFM